MEQVVDEKKRLKLKKQESFREVQESIKNFENKKEFVQVKLQTRHSFREDQEALNRRLSRRKSDKMQSSGGENEHDGKNSVDAVAAKLESIELDLNDENDKNIKTSGDVNNEGHVNNGYVGESPDINASRVEKDISHKTETERSGMVNGTGKCSGNETHETAAISATGDKKQMPNGHMRGSMTPEPRLKVKGRLYEKNDKLTASSSNHLDRISLKGAKATNHVINGLGPGSLIMQQTRDPLLPAADVSGLPKDGSLREFSAQQMITIFRMLNVREETVHRLFNSSIDGKRFSMFTDKDLRTLGIFNPIVCYFRDRSVQPVKKPPKFML